jgi:hypothetical protein
MLASEFDPDPEPPPVSVDEEEDDDEVGFSAVARLSFAAASWALAWSSASCAAVGSSVASSWPRFACWPTWTYTFCSVPLVLKFTLTSVPACTLPLPETVVCTTPSAAVTVCVDVLAELLGGPISAIASTATATASKPRMYRCHGLEARSRR